IATAMTLLSASLRFALRASLQLFKIAPGDFVAPERRLRTRILRDVQDVRVPRSPWMGGSGLLPRSW
ncbi:MAG TPA: hypothetical protein VIM41_13080, partial [Gammaproteobacteria bacterium]